jgi:4-hydroxybenzoate polyprenyltransferase
LKKFLKSALIWATGLTVIAVGIIAIDGGATPLTVQVVVVFWVLSFALVSAYKILRLARRFGANLGRELVANPKANIGDTFSKAGKSALEGRLRPPKDGNP